MDTVSAFFNVDGHLSSEQCCVDVIFLETQEEKNPVFKEYLRSDTLNPRSALIRAAERKWIITVKIAKEGSLSS